MCNTTLDRILNKMTIDFVVFVHMCYFNKFPAKVNNQNVIISMTQQIYVQPQPFTYSELKKITPNGAKINKNILKIKLNKNNNKLQ